LGSARISSCRVGRTDGRGSTQRLMQLSVRWSQNNVYHLFKINRPSSTLLITPQSNKTN